MPPSEYIFGLLGLAAFPVVLFIASYLTARVKRIRPGIYCIIIGVLLLYPGVYIAAALDSNFLNYFLLGNGMADLLLGLIFIFVGKDGMLLRLF